jgi:hypothetical protein
LVKKGDFLKIKGEMNFKLEDVSFKIQEIPWLISISSISIFQFFNSICLLIIIDWLHYIIITNVYLMYIWYDIKNFV